MKTVIICGGSALGGESGARCGAEFGDPALFWAHVEAHNAARAQLLDARSEAEMRQRERRAAKLGIQLGTRV